MVEQFRIRETVVHTLNIIDYQPIFALGEGGLLLTISISNKKKLENRLIPKSKQFTLYYFWVKKLFTC